MPRTCTICGHAQRVAIEKDLIAGVSFRKVAKRYDVSTRALSRHKEAHLPASIVKAKEAKEAVRSMDLMSSLEVCFQRVTLLFDACDRWLRDADDPSRYDIGARAEDLKVTYTEPGPDGPIQRKKKLSELLETVEANGRVISMVETKHADPRELVLKASARLETQLELLARLMGELKSDTTINVHLSPEWVQLRTAILRTLEPFPDARFAIAQVLTSGRTDVQH